MHEKWMQARRCGREKRVPLDFFTPWKRLTSHDKFTSLHQFALQALDYKTPYEGLSVRDLPARRRSVEHVWPRSKTVPDMSEALAMQARSDPLGWVVATRRANSQRGNLPLVIWRLDSEGVSGDDGNFAMLLKEGPITIDGERHYIFPLEQRARLARKWLYMRATYDRAVAPISRAQYSNRANIVALAKSFPVQEAETSMNRLHKTAFGLTNPLLDPNPDTYYDDPEWRAMVFGCPKE